MPRRAREKYLIDVNVLQQFKDVGNKNVLAWKASINDNQLKVSVLTLMEQRRGWEAKRNSDPKLYMLRIASIEAFEAQYKKWIVPVSPADAAAWAVTIQGASKHFVDRGLAGVAKARGMTVVTQNVQHFRGLGVRILNPFSDPPEIYEP